MVHAPDLIESGAPAILVGDYNIIPTDRDVYKPERWLKDALFAPEAREKFRELMGQGWTDALRTLHPDEPMFTFWHYWRNSFERDAGIRIDHALLSPALAKATEGCRRRPDAARAGKRPATTAPSGSRSRSDERDIRAAGTFPASRHQFQCDTGSTVPTEVFPGC